MKSQYWVFRVQLHHCFLRSIGVDIASCTQLTVYMQIHVSFIKQLLPTFCYSNFPIVLWPIASLCFLSRFSFLLGIFSITYEFLNMFIRLVPCFFLTLQVCSLLRIKRPSVDNASLFIISPSHYCRDLGILWSCAAMSFPTLLLSSPKSCVFLHAILTLKLLPRSP